MFEKDLKLIKIICKLFNLTFKGFSKVDGFAIFKLNENFYNFCFNSEFTSKIMIENISTFNNYEFEYAKIIKIDKTQIKNYILKEKIKAIRKM